MYLDTFVSRQSRDTHYDMEVVTTSGRTWTHVLDLTAHEDRTLQEPHITEVSDN
jgi:hypothetical protein